MHNEILDTIVVPRPNGSEAFFEVAAFIKSWLENRGFSVESHIVSLPPCMLEIIGASIILLAVTGTFLSLRKKSLFALACPLILVMIMHFEFVADISLVSGIYRIEGENLLVSFHPPGMEQEIIISSHYDSKTELFDHHSRGLLIHLGIYMFLFWAGVILFRWNSFRNGRSASLPVDIFHKISLLCMLLFWIFVAFAFGGGFMAEPSPGAVDNAASVAVMMLLAEEIGEIGLRKTGVTLVFFAGEELNMKGSRAYVHDRFQKNPPIPVYNINLEFLCQEGDYVFWKEDGNYLRRLATSPRLNDALGETVLNITGKEMLPLSSGLTGFSDSGSFLLAGIPSTTFSNSGCEELGTGYFHSSLDNRERIVEERIQEAVTILRETLVLMETAGYNPHSSSIIGFHL